MKLKPCSICKKITVTPVHVTEINKDGTTTQLDLCRTCGEKFTNIDGPVEEIPMQKQEAVDLTNITTPKQLLDFLAAIRGGPDDNTPPCECGMTVAEFDKHGIFGCPKCYDHFTNQMQRLVFPYHKANKHVGKIPKRWLAEKQANDPVEKMKLLKLSCVGASARRSFFRLLSILSTHERRRPCLRS
jgi:protein-arginine kinase activator protein McsA